MSAIYEARSGYQFVDTNILVYAHDKSAGIKREKAKSLMIDLWHSKNGCLSIQVLQEFFVTITRKVEKPVVTAVASKLIEDLSSWKVHSPNAQDVLDAIQIQQNYQISFWDAMIINSAIKMNCHILWSEDLNAGQMFDFVELKNPFV